MIYMVGPGGVRAIYVKRRYTKAEAIEKVEWLNSVAPKGVRYSWCNSAI